MNEKDIDPMNSDACSPTQLKELKRLNDRANRLLDSLADEEQGFIRPRRPRAEFLIQNDPPARPVLPEFFEKADSIADLTTSTPDRVEDNELEPGAVRIEGDRAASSGDEWDHSSETMVDTNGNAAIEDSPFQHHVVAELVNEPELVLATEMDDRQRTKQLYFFSCLLMMAVCMGGLLVASTAGNLGPWGEGRDSGDNPTAGPSRSSTTTLLPTSAPPTSTPPSTLLPTSPPPASDASTSPPSSTPQPTSPTPSFAATNLLWNQVGGDLNGQADFDRFGSSVSLSAEGKTFAVGIPGNDINGEDSGLVQVFALKEDEWIQLGENVYGAESGDDAKDKSGVTVSLSADASTMAVGSIGNDDNGSEAGHVRIFKRKGDVWSQLDVPIVGEAEGDEFGFSISLASDGTTVAIGSKENSGKWDRSGHVRVYRFVEGYWRKIGSDIDGENPIDYSGYSVSLSAHGNTVAVGAPYNDGHGDTSGHVRVYHMSNDTWTQIGEDIDGEAQDDFSGRSVSISAAGDILAIGAPFNGDHNYRAGHVRVFQLTKDEKFVQLGNDIEGVEAGDVSGEALSLSADGTVLAIGSRWNKENGASSGHVRVFRFSNNTWEQLGSDINGKASYNFFGSSVSLSFDGRVVAIGAPGNYENGKEAGQVQVFRIETGPVSAQPTTTATEQPMTGQPTPFPTAAKAEWTQVGSDLDMGSTSFSASTSVSLSSDGSILAVGSPYNNDNNDLGEVRLYKFLKGSWASLDEFYGESAEDFLGFSVAVSADGSTLVAGATGSDVNGERSGLVLTHRMNETESGFVPGEGAGDSFGSDVALSADGKILAVGAARNDGANGRASGHTRVFQNDADSGWQQLGGDIDGAATRDGFGTSVALSSEGKTIAVGAPTNDNGSGEDSGHVRIFRLEGFAWQQLGEDINGAAPYDFAGTSVALAANGSIVAVGMPGSLGENGPGSGRVQVYQLKGEAWAQLGDNIDGTNEYDKSGTAVSLSANGMFLAVGSPSSDGPAGLDRGHVRVYHFINDDWEPVGNCIFGKDDIDESGSSVSLSADGASVAIGAASSTLARVYRFQS